MTNAHMDKRFSQIQEEKQRFDRNNQISIPKIQRVPNFLRQNARFYKYCSPKFISFGPIHHNSEGLKDGEHYKLLWTSMFVAKYGEKINQDANQACKLLFKKIEDNIEELKNMFTEDAIEGYNDNDLAWMLFVDGCSLLHFMRNMDMDSPEALNLKYNQMMYMHRDAMLLENQLPSQMLEILCKDSGVNLKHCYYNYQTRGRYKRFPNVMRLGLENPIPFHILHLFHKFYFSIFGVENIEGQDQEECPDFRLITYKNIRDLKKAGIQVVESEAWISFKSKWYMGELKLPIFTVNYITLHLIVNCMAYEICPDVHEKYECCFFFSFMDSLIDNGDDVKELRSAKVIQNWLGISDEELANIFNELADDLPTNMTYTHNGAEYSTKYIRIKHQIEDHYTDKWKTWMAQAYNTYFNTPWAMITFFAASLALLLTVVQTWFAIHPKF